MDSMTSCDFKHKETRHMKANASSHFAQQNSSISIFKEHTTTNEKQQRIGNGTEAQKGQRQEEMQQPRMQAIREMRHGILHLTQGPIRHVLCGVPLS
jgi:hypothetical protein